MKKIKIIKSALFVLILFVFASCSDFLEIDPYGKSEADQYYSTEEEVGLALIAAYDMIHTDQFDGWASTFFMKQLPSDGTNCGGGGASDQPQYQKLDDFNWTSENEGITNYYRINYYGIYRCNQILTNTTVSSALVDQYLAEALFLRAYFYFELNVAFGGVPLWLVPPTTISEGKARASKAEVYAQVESDLLAAIPDLPNKSVYAGTADAFRTSKQAAQALLGKVYLYQEKYGDAIDAFEDVIASEGTDVDLEADFEELFKHSTEFGIESLFEASFIEENKTWADVGWDRTSDDNRHMQLSGPRGPFDGGTSGIIGGWGFNAPTQKLYDAFGTDPRRVMTIISTAELASLYGGSFEDAHDTEGMIRTKMTTYASETVDGSVATPELNYTTNWRLIRYADVLLMAAEAYHFDSQDGVALGLINQVRQRVGATDYVGLTGTDLFDALVLERQMELAYEGHRFWDLVRWGLADTELSSLGFVAGKHEVFPIPLDEILNNSELDASSQNPGY